MEIGLLGINGLSQTLCRHWVNKGHRILFSDLNVYSEGYRFAETLGQSASLVLPEFVSRHAEVIVLSVSLKDIDAAVDALGNVSQKIVLDMVSEGAPDSIQHSTFHHLKKKLPGAKVVKITPHFPFHLFSSDSNNTLYSYSNDHLAQRMVKWFVDGTGYKMVDLNIQSKI